MIKRTPELIADEINNLKYKVRTLVLENSIEIGSRLIEAKVLLKHGDWAVWLDKNFDYSQRTANNLMRICEWFGKIPNSSIASQELVPIIANMTYTQAVILMTLPNAVRVDFILTNDIRQMPTRKLYELVIQKRKGVTQHE